VAKEDRRGVVIGVHLKGVGAAVVKLATVNPGLRVEGLDGVGGKLRMKKKFTGGMEHGVIDKLKVVTTTWAVDSVALEDEVIRTGGFGERRVVKAEVGDHLESSL